MGLVESSNKYLGFDWFTATMYLMLRGNFDLTLDFLCRFSTTLTSLFLWMPRVYTVRNLLLLKNYI